MPGSGGMYDIRVGCNLNLIDRDLSKGTLPSPRLFLSMDVVIYIVFGLFAIYIFWDVIEFLINRLR